jgi:hypothetical protein
VSQVWCARPSSEPHAVTRLARAVCAAVLNGDAAAAYYVVEVAGLIIGQLMITFEWSDWCECL